ncbi:SET domain-containing protein [Hymenopellis radicata]|nr:SET domain-containing protein [Hymenopellis radicata]
MRSYLFSLMSAEFLTWLIERGGSFHPSAEFKKVPSGFCIIAKETIPADSTIVSCPFNLAITTDVALKALNKLLPNAPLSDWSERQSISSYLCFHRILDNQSTIPELGYGPYVKTLPSREKLRTGLHFTDTEHEMFRGTNMHGAILDRRNAWKEEWNACRAVVISVNETWGEQFTWDLYLESATHLSSRAFPSSLLSGTPTLISSSTTGPVLLPGVDALNHARAHPVSWVISTPNASMKNPSSSIALCVHKPTPAGQELFNNYGPKPNSELILGYGFTLPTNPDDTMLLKIQGNKWEISHDARGMDDVWNGFLSLVAQQEDSEYEIMLETADVLEGALLNLAERFPSTSTSEIRSDVATMLLDYVEGQRDILNDALQYVERKRHDAVDLAKQNGIEIILEER